MHVTPKVAFLTMRQTMQKSDKLWNGFDEIVLYIWPLMQTVLCQTRRGRSEITFLTIPHTHFYT